MNIKKIYLPQYSYLYSFTFGNVTYINLGYNSDLKRKPYLLDKPMEKDSNSLILE